MRKTSMDQDGYPCPPLLEPMSFPDFELRHVQGHPYSKTRMSIFVGYQGYLRDFQRVVGVGFKQWVNGSFTTTKQDPEDVDIINFVPNDALNAVSLEQLAGFQTSGGSRDNYMVDAYIIPVYPTSTTLYITRTLLVALDWASEFGFDSETGQEKNVAQLLFP